jgi:glutamyl-tRNA synthetase
LTVSSHTFNPVVVDFYREIGYLPEALVNYLLLLGWSLDDKTEEFTRREMIQHFSLERVNKAPASFDAQKLQAFQERGMRALPVAQKVKMVLPYLEMACLVPSPPSDAELTVRKIVEAAGDRIKIAGDILDYADLFTADAELPYDEKALDKRLRKPAEAPELLAKFRAQLASVEPFDASTLERRLHEFVDAEGIKVGQIIHALRVAVTGKPVGFGMFETLAVLGRDRSLARIDRALSLLEQRTG